MIAFDDDNEIFENKKQAALKVMDIALSIKDNYALHMDYLAIMAKTALLLEIGIVRFPIILNY